MPPRKKNKLSDTLLVEEPVRWGMNCGRVVIQPQDQKLVPMAHGQYGAVEVPGVELTRLGTYSDELFTRFYDPAKPEDKNVIDTVREFVRVNPRYENDISIGLREYGMNDPIKPFPDYDTADAERIGVVVENSGQDIASVLKYELTQRRDAAGELDPRDDVIDVLNDLYASQSKAKADATDGKVEGL